MHDLRRTEQPKHGIPVGCVGDVAGEQPHGCRQIDGLTWGMHLRVQNIQHSDVITGLDQAARQRGPDESSSTSDKHGL